MKNQKDDILMQKQSLLTFTSDSENDQLLIKAQSESTLYCASLDSNPFFSFDKIKKALSTKNYELVSIDPHQMEISIGGVFDIQLKSQDQLALQFLKDAIHKLTLTVQKEALKNDQLESIVKDIQNEILLIKNQQLQQKASQNQKHQTLQWVIQQLNAKTQENAKNQQEEIKTIKQEILALKEEISKQKEFIDNKNQKVGLNNQELKHSIDDEQAQKLFETVNSLKQQLLKAQQASAVLDNKLTNCHGASSQAIAQLRKNIQDYQTQQAATNKVNDKKLQQHSTELTQRTKLHDELKNELSQLANKSNQNKTSLETANQQTSQTIINLTAQLTQLKTHLNQTIAQTIPKQIAFEPEIFHDSRIVCSFEEKSNIRKFFNKIIKHAKLLYRASENDFCAKKFHEKCNGISNTLTVAWTEFDKKIGGFTPLKWKSSQKTEFLEDHSKDSFIFSLTNNGKFILDQPEKAIYSFYSYGPAFGYGSDLHIKDKANLEKTSYASICTSYKNEKYKKNNKASWEMFHGDASGSQYFNLKQWQVWALNWA